MSDDPPGSAPRDDDESSSDPFEKSALLVYSYLKSKHRYVEHRVDSVGKLFRPDGTVGLTDNAPVDDPRTARPTPRAAVAPAARLERLPATRSTTVLRCVLTHAAYDKVILPYVAQEQHEYSQALLAGDSRQASIIRVRMYLLLVALGARTLILPLMRIFQSAS
jgi:hypothetical protein